MIERLSKLHQSRLNQSISRRSDADSSAPFESTQAFLNRFADSKRSIESELDRLGFISNDLESNPQLKSDLEKLSISIADLEKLVAENSYFLPSYEVRSTFKAIAELKESLESVSLKLVPRKKFSFRNKPAQKDPANAVKESEISAKESNFPVKGGDDAASAEKSRFETRDSPGFRNQVGAVLVKQFQGFESGDFTLSNLESCEIGLKGRLRALFVHRLRNCRVFVGPVLGSILIEEVEGCLFMLASHQIRIHHAKATDFYLRVRSRPIIEDCSSVRFAPYLLVYEGIEEELRESGLAEDTGNWENVDDFRWLRAVQSPNWCSLPKEEQEGNEPLVSAALDFKAMLEAALLSPYKFYDNESSSLPDAVGGQNNNVEDMHAKMDYISSTASSTIAVAKSNDSLRASSIEDSSVPSAAGSVTFLPQADNNTQKLCSALLSESLFDTEEDFLSSNQMKCAQIPASTEESYGSECTEVADDVKLPGNYAGLSIQESEVIPSRNGKVILHEELLLEVGDNSEFFSSDRSHFSLHDEGTSLTSAGSENKSEKSVKPSQYDSSLINKVSEEEKISGSSSATLGDSFSNTENKISAGQTVDQSLSVTSKVVNDSEIDEENCLSEHLPKPVPSLSGSCPESSSMKSCTESSSAVPGESITKSRTEKPIINDIPGRVDPMFSTVVSVSPELGSLSSSTTLSRTCDLDTWSGSSEENPNSSDATIEESTKTTESCNTAELTPELSQTSEAIGRPSVLEVGDDLEAVSSIHECSDAGENSNGEPCIVIEESQI